MGTGIAAAVPLVFTPYEQWGSEKLVEKYFAQGFLDNFDVAESNSKKLYTIKPELLLGNYSAFLEEFYDLIEEDFHESTDLTFGHIPSANSIEEFIKIFDGNNRNNQVPFMYNPHFLSVRGCECRKYWLFYSGSYKAFLESYSTLVHFEKILAKAMTNPLANAVKFGIFG